jgi:hypothetical protein
VNGEFMFGVRRGKLTRAEVALRERIAERHGCTHVYANIPGTGLQSWFAGPDTGEPFNTRLSRAVAADLEAGK